MAVLTERFRLSVDRVVQELLMMVIVKAADVSNEIRPPEVSLPWMNRLFEEFGRQYDREVELGLKETPFMNSKTVSKPSAQIGFIKYDMLHVLHVRFSSRFLESIESSGIWWFICIKCSTVKQQKKE